MSLSSEFAHLIAATIMPDNEARKVAEGRLKEVRDCCCGYEGLRRLRTWVLILHYSLFDLGDFLAARESSWFHIQVL